MNVLANLEPKDVFKYFEELSQIPRGSGNEQEVSDYLVKFAKDLGLEVAQDEALNVIIKKNAAKGMENAPGIILQGHMDMVNEKNTDVVHNFLKDPLKLYIEGDYIRAKGTTLGGDNGIAVALSMAILAGDYKHPPLAVLITTDEEAGMSGAKAVDFACLDGYNYLINLDSGDDRTFTVSCAGGIRHAIEFNLDFTDTPKDYTSYKLQVRGLFGGHSGEDIGKNLANSNRLMARLLWDLKDRILLSHLSGGAKNNAIPREADAIISFAGADKEKVMDSFKRMEAVFKKEFAETEPNLTLVIEETDFASSSFTGCITKKILQGLILIPLGLNSTNKKGENISSNNIGVVTTSDNKVVLDCLSRANILSKRDFYQEQLKTLAELLDAEYKAHNTYSGWESKTDSSLKNACTEVYENLFGETPDTISIHGGVECGIFAEKNPNLDMISYGPDMYHLHTPEEKLNIPSTGKVYKFLIALLESL